LKTRRSFSYTIITKNPVCDRALALSATPAGANRDSRITGAKKGGGFRKKAVKNGLLQLLLFAGCKMHYW
jgi:hypothetical protein